MQEAGLAEQHVPALTSKPWLSSGHPDEGRRWLFQREAQIPQRSGKIWRLTEKRGRSTKQENDKSSKNAGKGSFLDVKPEGLSFTEEPLLKKATKLTWSSGGKPA